VKKKTNDTWFHNHTTAFSTWMHAGRVVENAYVTPQQQLKTSRNQNRTPFFSNLVAAVKNFSSHKERKQHRFFFKGFFCLGKRWFCFRLLFCRWF